MGGRTFAGVPDFFAEAGFGAEALKVSLGLLGACPAGSHETTASFNPTKPATMDNATVEITTCGANASTRR